MRAIAVSNFGATPKLIKASKPSPGPRELLVEVAAAGINPFDWKVADGMLKGIAEHVFPLVLGSDFSGTVVAVGKDVDEYGVGDHVFGQASRQPIGTGTYAEYVVVPQDGPIARAPHKIPLAMSAAVPTAGMTALGIMESAGIQEYRNMLIIGAAGGVGSFLTQLAASHEIEVIAAVIGNEDERMMGLGAAMTIDLTRQKLTDVYPEGVDALVDLASGAEVFKEHTELVHAGGLAVSTRGVVDIDDLANRDIEGVNFGLTATSAAMTRLAEEIDSGEVVVPIETEVDLEHAPDAIAANLEGRARGKTIISMR